MSRIGKRKLNIPLGVTVVINGNVLVIKGAKGEISVTIPSMVQAKVTDSVLETVPAEGKSEESVSSFLGLSNSLIKNGIEGVTSGFTKTLELVGVGYRAKKTDTGISMTLGFSHPVDYETPAGVSFDVQDNTKITISGVDKQLVGLVSAKIRSIKKPEPYKGKGIRYAGEVVRRKAGKAGKAQK